MLASDRCSRVNAGARRKGPSLADENIVIEGVDGNTYEIPSGALPKPGAVGGKKGKFVFGQLTIRTDDGIIEIPMDEAKKYRKNK